MEKLRMLLVGVQGYLFYRSTRKINGSLPRLGLFHPDYYTDSKTERREVGGKVLRTRTGFRIHTRLPFRNGPSGGPLVTVGVGSVPRTGPVTVKTSLNVKY